MERNNRLESAFHGPKLNGAAANPPSKPFGGCLDVLVRREFTHHIAGWSDRWMAGGKNSFRRRFWFHRRHCDRDRRKPDRDLATLSVRRSPWERFPYKDCGRHHRSYSASTRRRD